MIEAAQTLTDFASGASDDASALAFRLRRPTSEDAARVWTLIASSPPLDQNSLYANLLQCTHFAGGCVVAERDGEIVGWISSYRPPEEPDTLFIWQIAVAAECRGQRLGRALIRELLARPSRCKVERIQTTISPENDGSWAMFRSLARDLGASIDRTAWFDRDRHFGGRHPDEHLVTITPLGDAA